MIKQEEILNLLVKNAKIAPDQLKQVRAQMAKGISLESVLSEMEIIDVEDLVKLRAKAAGLLYKNLLGEKIDPSVLNVIPVGVSENYKIVCFNKTGKKIKIGLVDNDDFKAIEAVNFLAKKDGLRAEFHLISELSFNTAIKQYKTLSEEITSALKTKESEDAQEVEKRKKEEGGQLEEITKSAPVAKIVSVIIYHAVEGRASDIHIEPLQKETRVRYRIDGILKTSLVLPKNIHSAIVARIKVMTSLKLDETRLPQDGRLRLNIEGKNVDFRVSILPLMDEEKVVMRILDTTRGAPELEELGFIGPGLEIIQRNIQKTEGMFLVTGPTGSGKSTTLFSIINRMNKEGVNISTLEDPVEYFIQGVNQSQVRPEIGFTFASGLRTLLRQDPNVVMVGEIRDNETAELAIHAGLTGHFVLSTLHTNDAIGAIPRLVDMKVEPFLLGSTLNTIVAQRLARKICEHCKTETELPAETAETVRNEIGQIPEKTIRKILPDFDINNLKFYKGKGCARCGNLGYSGRVSIAEVIDINDRLKDIIIDGKRIMKMDDVKDSQEFITLRQDGLIKVLLGSTTMEEVLRVIYD
ncbi:MAG: GspE/PulE family protein [Patescibacteria group bacterium]